jgi:hypothetical protein
METWTRYPSLARDLTADRASLLEKYCLLSRIGDFQAAEKLWIGHLQQNESSFLYSISYIDGVLRQSRYGDARDFLKKHLHEVGKELPASQLMVLSSMEAYLDVFTHGRLRAAIVAARSTLKWLSATNMEQYDEYQVRY